MQAYDLNDSFIIRPIPRPLVNVCLAFCAGILYAHFFPFNLGYALAVLVLLILIWAASVRKPSTIPPKQIHWRMALILIALLGAIRMQATIQTWNELSEKAAEIGKLGELTIEGTVAEVNSYDGEWTTVVLTTITLNKSNRIHSYTGDLELRGTSAQLGRLHPGERIQTSSRIAPIQGPSVPTGFDSQTRRYSRNIFASASIDNDAKVSQRPTEKWTPIRGIAYRAVDKTRNQLPNNEAVGLISSICFGLRSYLPTELSNALTRSGLAHLTSISGLHVTMILVLAAFLLKRLGFKRKQAAWFVGAFAVFYLFTVGARIPTIRAVLMTFALLGSHLTERKIDSLNSLALAAFVLLILDPSELFLASFQLSFAAVLVLILYSPIGVAVQKSISFLPLAWLIQGTLASIAAVIGLAPLTITYFHIFSWGAIFGNLIAIPIVAILLPLVYAWMLVALFPLPWLNVIIGDLSMMLSQALLSVIHYFSSPIFSIETPAIPIATGALMFLSVLMLARPALNVAEIRFIPIRAYQAALAFLGLALWIPTLVHPWTPLRVDFLALGQGDCNVIHTPEGQVVVIDGGPTPRNQSPSRPSQLVRYLKSVGVGQIDAIVLTHPQSDHIGALGDVVQRIPVSIVLEGCRESDVGTYQKFEEILEQKQVKRQLVRMGDRIDLGKDSRLWILNPPNERLPKGIDINEKSVVVLFQYNEWDFLFTGDIGLYAEKQLVERFDGWDVDVLKVPHHGSRHSSNEDFLNETKPEFAVIQVGKNPYGHPNDEARYRLIDAGAHVLRNDEDGTVRLKAWPHQLRLFTTRSNKLYLFNKPNLPSEPTPSLPGSGT